MPTVKELEAFLFSAAPKDLAMHWDNVGLLVGQPEQAVRHVLVALDITEEVVQEAAAEGMELIVAHHPVMNCKWLPVQTVRTDTPQGRILMELIRSGISAICMHTNLDIAEDHCGHDGRRQRLPGSGSGIKRCGAAGRRRMRACRRVAGRNGDRCLFAPCGPGAALQRDALCVCRKTGPPRSSGRGGLLGLPRRCTAKEVRYLCDLGSGLSRFFGCQGHGNERDRCGPFSDRGCSLSQTRFHAAVGVPAVEYQKIHFSQRSISIFSFIKFI